VELSCTDSIANIWRSRVVDISTVFIFGLFICASNTLAQVKHRISLADLQTLKTADYLQISPAGDSLAFVVDGEIWVVPTQQPAVPRSFGHGELPVWSPDSKALAYYSGASGSLQLFVRNIASGDVRQLTRIAGGINPDPYTRLLGWTEDPLRYSWSPDGEHLVFASQVAVAAPPVLQERRPDKNESTIRSADAPLILTEQTPPDWTLSGIFQVGGFGRPAFANGRIDWTRRTTSDSPQVNELFIVDVKTGSLRQITNDSAIYFNPSWSPDGQTIVCSSSEGHSLLGGGNGTTNIYAIDVVTGAKTVLTYGTGDKRMPSWSADGRWIAYLGGEHFGLQSVFVVKAEGGKAINIASALNRYVIDFLWEPDSNSILATYQDGVYWPIARIDIQSGHTESLIRNDTGVRMHVTISRSGDVAWEETSGSSRGLLSVLAAHSRKPHILLDLNPQINFWQLGEQEVIRWRNNRGDDLEGILIKPVGYAGGRKYPLIVDAYPGQTNGFKDYAMTGNQAWASQGYAIFWPNSRAPHVWMNPFKSKDHDEAGKGPAGLDVMVDDIISGIDELIREGIADPERIGLYGFSNGGGVVNQIVTKTDRFKCAVSVAGAISVDWLRGFFLQTMNPMTPEMAGSLPWEDPEAYLRLSALFRLNHVHTPMLLADGDNDGDFLLNTIEMYNGLRYLGRDVTLLRYPNQGHGFEGAALADFWRREETFFSGCLKPGTLPN
jgi:dipeptidyl aminopeptidase/acylaminoacyl peptidase